MISIKQGLVTFGIWILLMVLAELITIITDKEDERMKDHKFELKEFHDMLGYILENNHAPEIDIRLNYDKFYDIWTDIHRIITYNENMQSPGKSQALTEPWEELKETIEELRDNGGTATQQEVCTFIASLMEVLENGKKED